jgi:serine/threonine-protein kinase
MALPYHSPFVGLTTGTLLQGRYRLIRETGGSLASAVYLAQDVEAGTNVTVKVFALPDEYRERLRREAAAVRDLDHEHIARLHDYFESGERSVLISDHVGGPDLASYLATGGPLVAEEVAAVGRGIALALRAAHRRGLLHRGVAPKSILLAPEVRAKLIDFGVADVEGDRDFRAPEAFAGQGVDGRADLYGLGLTLYLLVAGELPPRQARNLPPLPSPDGFRPSTVRPSIPSWLDAAIAQATAALPADRFLSAGRFAEALTPGRAMPQVEATR